MTTTESLLNNLSKFHDKSGNLSFVEDSNILPFSIKRTYWIYDVPGLEKRVAMPLKR